MLVSWSQMDTVSCVLYLVEWCAGQRQLASARHDAVCTLPGGRCASQLAPGGHCAVCLYLVKGCAGQLVTDGH